MKTLLPSLALLAYVLGAVAVIAYGIAGKFHTLLVLP